jgi:hypothetical protein
MRLRLVSSVVLLGGGGYGVRWAGGATAAACIEGADYCPSCSSMCSFVCGWVGGGGGDLHLAAGFCASGSLFGLQAGAWCVVCSKVKVLRTGQQCFRVTLLAQALLGRLAVVWQQHISLPHTEVVHCSQPAAAAGRRRLVRKRHFPKALDLGRRPRC